MHVKKPPRLSNIRVEHGPREHLVRFNRTVTLRAQYGDFPCRRSERTSTCHAYALKSFHLSERLRGFWSAISTQISLICVERYPRQ